LGRITALHDGGGHRRGQARSSGEGAATVIHGGEGAAAEHDGEGATAEHGGEGVAAQEGTASERFPAFNLGIPEGLMGVATIFT
jgi:hypothetical protein